MRNSFLLVAVSASALVAGCARKTDQAFQDVAPAASTNQTAPSAVAPLTQLSQEALSRGDAAAAIPLAERALESSPGNVDATLTLAQAQLMRGDPVKAEQLFRDVLKSDDTSAVANTGLGLSLLAQQRVEAARAVLLTAADQKASAQAKSNIAFALTLADSPKEAIKLLEPVAMGKDSTPKLRQNLAFALVMANDRARAFEVAGYDLDGVAAARQVAAWTDAAHATFKQRMTEMAGLTVIDAPAYAQAEAPKVAVSEKPVVVAAVVPSVRQEIASPVVVAKADAPKEEEKIVKMAAATAPETVQPAQVKNEMPVEVAQPVLVAAASVPKSAAAKPVVLRNKAPVSPVVTASLQVPGAPADVKKTVAAAATVTKFANWVVQIGAVTLKIDQTKYLMKAFQSRLGKGTAVRVVAVDAPNGKLHRVLLGQSMQRSVALSTCASLRAKGRACFARSEATVSQPVLPVPAASVPQAKVAVAKPVVLKATVVKSAPAKPVVTKAVSSKPVVSKAPLAKVPAAKAATKAAPAKDASKVVKI